MSILFKCPDNEARLSRLAPSHGNNRFRTWETCYYLQLNPYHGAFRLQVFLEGNAGDCGT